MVYCLLSVVLNEAGGTTQRTNKRKWFFTEWVVEILELLAIIACPVDAKSRRVLEKVQGTLKELY